MELKFHYTVHNVAPVNLALKFRTVKRHDKNRQQAIPEYQPPESEKNSLHLVLVTQGQDHQRDPDWERPACR